MIKILIILSIIPITFFVVSVLLWRHEVYLVTKPETQTKPPKGYYIFDTRPLELRGYWNFIRNRNPNVIESATFKIEKSYKSY